MAVVIAASWSVMIFRGCKPSIASRNCSNNQTKLLIFSFLKKPHPNWIVCPYLLIPIMGAHGIL
jgi:hypothetical protein